MGCATTCPADPFLVVMADPEGNELWVLVHLIAETARHLGHLDVLREHLDGTTGE